jgi:hypothetical protein
LEAEKLEKALQRAYEEAYRILQPALLSTTRFLSLILSVEYDEEGPISLVVYVEIQGRHAREAEPLVGEAVNAAARAFEEELGIRVNKKVRIRHRKSGKRGASSSS